MQRFVSFIGQRVEAHYRAGDLHLAVIGILVSDTGDTLHVEERFSQNGREKMMRVLIPYDYVIRVVEHNPQ
jgi:hypothetical protein